MTIKSPKKLIEVALPLDAINTAAAREKSIRHGHPSTLHLWWARRPLAAARAVIFAQMVNDPGYQQGGGFRFGVNKEKAQAERERLFKIIEDLVQWENTNNEEVLERARVEIRRSWREVCELNKSHPQAAELFNPDKLPAFHDPFAGGGALPLEAQRLGLESYASDLNPVAVTINKAMIEIPPRFAGLPPVNPEARNEWLGDRNALSGMDRLAEGNGFGQGDLSVSSAAAERGNLPEALDEMTRGGVNSPVAPVDLSQAIIGPGMAIFSQYAAVLEADGSPMRVKTALQLINRFLAEDDFDHDTQFCLHWFEQQGWATGKYGEADVLARAKGTSVGGLVEAGVVESAKGELRLLKWAEMPRDWSPETDARLPIWEALHQLIRALNQDGESAAGGLLARMPNLAEPIRSLAYRLYTLCERKGWAEEARAYNELVTAWSAIEQAAGEAGVVGSQGQLEI